MKFSQINPATKLTLFRIFLIPFFMVFMFVDNLWTRIFALIIFVIAAITDLYDGVLARRFKVITNFGIFLDPLADKLLISAAFISFVGLRELKVPAWMVVFIISREFLITGLRLLAMSTGKIIAADKTGKFKTTSQIVSIIIILIILILNSMGRKYNLDLRLFKYLLSVLPYWIMLFITALTVYSGISYLYKHRQIFTGQISNIEVKS
ncbi:MAG: CDP-diacylglycerol--glycerol-3-phosphate 3-phosphatidyltransferase [Elusimicrobiota bacterium]